MAYPFQTNIGALPKEDQVGLLVAFQKSCAVIGCLCINHHIQRVLLVAP